MYTHLLVVLFALFFVVVFFLNEYFLKLNCWVCRLILKNVDRIAKTGSVSPTFCSPNCETKTLMLTHCSINNKLLVTSKKRIIIKLNKHTQSYRVIITLP